MVIELIRFFSAAAILVVPGIWIARGLSLGGNFFERFAVGCSLGLATAIYLASAVSHLDLRWFYPAWGAVAVASGAVWVKSPKRPAEGSEVWNQIWMVLLLIVVGVI